MSVDREKLIEAAARRMVDDETLLVHTRPLVGVVLDALAPLIGDAIEAEKASNEFRNVVIDRCAALVRSLGGNDRSGSE